MNSAPFELRLLDLMPNRWNILSMDQAATQQVALATNGFIDECICEVTRLSHISKFRNRVWRNGLLLPLPGGRLFLSMGRTIESEPSRPPFGGGTGFAPFVGHIAQTQTPDCDCNRAFRCGPSRIRTYVGNAGRFTVCSLWPLGHRPICLRLLIVSPTTYC